MKHGRSIGLIVIGLGLAGPGWAEDPAAEAFLKGDLKQAERLLTKEIKQPRVRSSRFLLLGRVHFMQENWKKSRETLELLLQRDPENPRAHELYARTLFRLDHHNEALPYYRRAVREFDRSEIRLELAEVLIALGRTSEAIPPLKHVLQDKRVWPRAHLLLGRIRLAAGSGYWAGDHLWKAWKLGVRDPALHEDLARAFYLAGRVTGPLRLVGTMPDDEIGRRDADGMTLRPAGSPNYVYRIEPDTALYQIEEAMARNPTPSGRWLAARLWLIAENPDRADEVLKDADPKARDTLALRLRIALARGELKKMVPLIRAFPPGQAPSDEEVVGRLLEAALMAQVKGEFEPSLSFLRIADDRIPGRSDVLRLTVDLLIQLGREEEAREKMRLLRELHPDSPDIALLADRFEKEVQP
ncbi:MAG: tetratricopeptide repeat protein [Verrucomicrobiota bacterium]